MSRHVLFFESTYRYVRKTRQRFLLTCVLTTIRIHSLTSLYTRLCLKIRRGEKKTLQSAASQVLSPERFSVSKSILLQSSDNCESFHKR